MKKLLVCGAALLLIVACGGEKAEESGRTEEPGQEEQMNVEAEPTGRPLTVNSTESERVQVAMEHKDEMLELTGEETATLKTSKGDIKVMFYKDAAPLTVNNFIKLSKLGFYDGSVFHRYVPNFVIQGGDPKGTGFGDAGYTIPLEVDENVKHDKGALGMARSQDPNSGSCQFYITLAPTHNLDMGYTVFGYVSQGMDVVMELRQDDKIDRVDIHE
jgi:cyclophilin family peptidyl-prolyl cis-trans isomerase